MICLQAVQDALPSHPRGCEVGSRGEGHCAEHSQTPFVITLSPPKHWWKWRETAASTNLVSQTVNIGKVFRQQLVQTTFTFSLKDGDETTWVLLLNWRCPILTEVQ